MFGGIIFGRRSDSSGRGLEGTVLTVWATLRGLGQDLDRAGKAVASAGTADCIRSERMLMGQLEYNLLFRWFVGLNISQPVWLPTGFNKYRDRSRMGIPPRSSSRRY